MKHLAFFLILLASTLQSLAQERPIGHVGGRPVVASQITGSTEMARTQSLQRLFVSPALRAYLEPHRREWEFTEADLQQVMHAIREDAKCAVSSDEALSPEREKTFARWLGANLKIQRFIHVRNGGGRILFQQLGMEAFDATRQLLLDLEKQEAFAITDPALREQTLGYWLHDPKAGLLPDPGMEKAFRLDRPFNNCPSR